MNKREWLVLKGLAKPNSRGRFSLQAQDALKQAAKDGIIFDEKSVQQNSTVIEDEYVEPPVRDLGEEIIGYTRGGFIFAFSSCRACGRHINYCKCSHILAPAIIESLPAESPAIIVRRKRL